MEEEEENPIQEDNLPHVWNPIHDPNRRTRWTVINYPIEVDRYPLVQFFVLDHKDDDDVRKLYFNIPNILLCMGYTLEDVSKVLEEDVPDTDKIRGRVGLFEGYFLTKDGVLNLADKTEGAEAFRTWFRAYVERCENNLNINLVNKCPA
ncbi:30s ribosomal protein s1 [Lasius niger]|uniref:30s ribosomal protein s1 n=1 Tax=Lasius niger TaxID=67767 RepID=A0A0J7JZV1_LASNI|nr:30s ribosomal protein s1 [Lasius niger]